MERDINNRTAGSAAEHKFTYLIKTNIVKWWIKLFCVHENAKVWVHLANFNPVFLFQSIRFELLHHLCWSVPAEWSQPADVIVSCEPGGDSIGLHQPAQREWSGTGAAVQPSNLVGLCPAYLLARF